VLLGAFFDVTNPTEVGEVAPRGPCDSKPPLGAADRRERIEGIALHDFDTRTDSDGLAPVVVAASAVGTPGHVTGHPLDAEKAPRREPDPPRSIASPLTQADGAEKPPEGCREKRHSDSPQ
jgi:hypothetical protein